MYSVLSTLVKYIDICDHQNDPDNVQLPSIDHLDCVCDDHPHPLWSAEDLRSCSGKDRDWNSILFEKKHKKMDLTNKNR